MAHWLAFADGGNGEVSGATLERYLGDGRDR